MSSTKVSQVSQLIEDTTEYPDLLKAVDAAHKLYNAHQQIVNSKTNARNAQVLKNVVDTSRAAAEAKQASAAALDEAQKAGRASLWLDPTVSGLGGTKHSKSQLKAASLASDNLAVKQAKAASQYRGDLPRLVGQMNTLKQQVDLNNNLVQKLQKYNTLRQTQLRANAAPLDKAAAKQCVANQRLADNIHAADTADAEASDAMLKVREHIMRRGVLAVLVILVAYRTMKAQMGGGANSVDIAILLAALVYVLYSYYNTIVRFITHGWRWLMLRLGADN